MRRTIVSLALALTMCLGLSIAPAWAASPYSDGWGSRFSDVLSQEKETFTGYGDRKDKEHTVYYLAPDATVRVGKRAEKLGYLEIRRDEITSLEKTADVGTTEKTYTRDQLEKEFGFYDLYCLITLTEDKEYEYLYFLFDDSASSNALDYVLQSNGTVLEKYRGTGGAMVIPDGVVQIKSMFMDTGTAASVTSLTLPGSVREIEGWTFNNCVELSSVTLPSGLRTLGDYAFSGCSGLTSVTVPAGLSETGSGVFSDCGLSRVTLQSGLKSIGSSMFSGCQKLVFLSVPASVTEIGSRAFANCGSLNSVIIENGNAQIGEDAFSQGSFMGIPMTGASGLTISAPSGGTVEAYCKAHNITFRATGSVPTQPGTPSNPGTPAAAAPTNDSLTADGVLQSPTVYKINDSNYFKIRDRKSVV